MKISIPQLSIIIAIPKEATRGALLAFVEMLFTNVFGFSIFCVGLGVIVAEIELIPNTTAEGVADKVVIDVL